MDELWQQDIQVQNGEFGADMQVRLINDGPVTLVLDSSVKFPHRGAADTESVVPPAK